jgi:hypothetical protein
MKIIIINIELDESKETERNRGCGGCGMLQGSISKVARSD